MKFYIKVSSFMEKKKNSSDRMRKETLKRYEKSYNVNGVLYNNRYNDYKLLTNMTIY